jgi:gluconate 2-dehydrogenase gamma chain
MRLECGVHCRSADRIIVYYELMNDEVSRRALLSQTSRSAVLTWLAAQWPLIAQAQEHAHRRVATTNSSQDFLLLTHEEAAEIAAIAEQILPSDETPGAREAGVVFFIDKALHTFDADKLPAYRRGLKELRAKVSALFPGASRLAQLPPAQQHEVMKAIERSDFFEMVRTHTLIGFFGNPEWGGNRDLVGWKLIGFEDAFTFHPPFGYYDGPGRKVSSEGA